MPKTANSARAARIAIPAILLTLAAASRAFSDPVPPPPPTPLAARITVDTRPASLSNTFIPIQTIGAGVDGVAAGHVKTIYTPDNIRQLLTAGNGPISYRLYTELSVQQWHWNLSGHWSDPAAKSGYFTGDEDSKVPVLDTYGYNLPHRGGTHDQGNSESYSRIDDGDPETYWKSNPYLTSAYTHEPDAQHPQWILVDLGSNQPMNAIQINWCAPYAVQYKVQYWIGPNPVDNPAPVRWSDFPTGTITSGQGGVATTVLAPQPVTARYVRVWMTQSSGTQAPDESASDPRSKMGYAISELGVGTVDAGGAFHDLLTHEPDDKQSIMYCSSTDPWHSDADREIPEEQPGFDTIFRSGITRGLPSMVPVPVVYGTPEDAVAEIAFLRHRGYKISYVESGEEADEEWISPEDFGSLYCQWVTAIHKRFPDIKFGGPVMASHAFTSSWADASGRTDWLQRFYSYLQSHGHAQDLAFYSFEFYPDARGGFNGQGLFESEDAVRQMFDEKRGAGIPDSVPSFLTEYNVGGSSQQPQLYGAVWHADFLANFLTTGGKGIYFYEYEPLPFEVHGQEVNGFSLFSSDANNKIIQPLSQYYSNRLTNLYWLDGKHSDKPHELYRATSDLPPVDGHATVTAYAVHRPDGQWSVLLANKNAQGDCDASLTFTGADGVAQSFTGPVTLALLSPAQYAFHPDGAASLANPDGPEAVSTVQATPTTTYRLPAQSILVVTGKIQASR